MNGQQRDENFQNKAHSSVTTRALAASQKYRANVRVTELRSDGYKGIEAKVGDARVPLKLVSD